ncbi:MAG: DUF4175 family protein [Gemmatimonadaceae bacterium]
MTAPPESAAVRAILARAARRLAWMSAAEGAAIGLGLALALAAAGWPAPGAAWRSVFAGLSLAAAGAGARVLTSSGRRRHVAHLVERRAPQCRNLLVTASELLARSAASHSTPHVAEHVRTIVLRQAARLAGGLDPAALFPARNALTALGAAAMLWALVVSRAALPRAVRATRSSQPASPAPAASITIVDVTIAPPAYAAAPAQSLRDPARVEALVGSRVRLTVRATAAAVSIETVRGRQVLAAAGPNAFTGELLADADGYIAIAPATSDGRVGTRRLIGLTVAADAAPRVRLTAPGRDLLLPDARHTIELGVEADDDIGLASLRLRYTKVSGAGERFTFAEGQVPLEIARAGARRWTARARWRLDGLGLEPGDMVVYRAVATDARPGSAPSESDAFIAELLAPGGGAAAGFALDPEGERYAVSQQMVILKTERLAARRGALTAAAFTAEAQELAAEQRKVRAEFVFMMGGELADDGSEAGSTDLDEVAEAEGESDLAAGRSANQGQVALRRGIRAMSRAAAALTRADLALALTHERAALAQLERAFSHARIILRALAQRERLDPSRRLTGVMTDIARGARASAEPELAPRVTALRAALSAIAELAGSPRSGADAPERALALAERVLRVDPSDEALHEVAELLATAAGAMGRGRADDARSSLDRAATRLATALRAGLPQTSRPALPPELNRLSGALNDALRHPRPARGRGGA